MSNPFESAEKLPTSDEQAIWALRRAFDNKEGPASQTEFTTWLDERTAELDSVLERHGSETLFLFQIYGAIRLACVYYSGGFEEAATETLEDIQTQMGGPQGDKVDEALDLLRSKLGRTLTEDKLDQIRRDIVAKTEAALAQ